MKTQYDCIILGAGSSGLMCAATMVKRGKSVLLLDHNTRIGRKIAIAGGGKANITNRYITETDYLSTTPRFLRSALDRFSPNDLLQMIKKENIPTEEREHGQIFCRQSAEDIVDLFRNGCTPCSTILNAKIISVQRKKEYFYVTTHDRKYAAPSLVIATGSPAYPQAGGSDIGTRIAKQFGHTAISWRPALVGFIMPKNWLLSGLSGVSLPVSIDVVPCNTQQTSFKRNNKKAEPLRPAQSLSLLFTHTGISGPAALQASLYWENNDALRINFLPGLKLEKILRLPENGKKLLKNIVIPYLPTRLGEKLLSLHKEAETKTAELSAVAYRAITATFQHYLIMPEATEGIKKAEAAKGGVSTLEISSKTMESRLVSRLFFCGEVLDVTGRLGGYNLHWAFASGKAAGEHA